MSYSYSQQQPSQQQQVQQYQQQQPQYSSQPPQQQQQQPQQSSSQSLYPSSSSTLQKHVPPPAHSMPSAQSEEDPTFGPLERAGKIVGEQQVRDAGLIGDLGDGLQGTTSRAYTLPPSPNFAPFVKKRTYNIPDGLFAEYEALTHKCFMGIFPSIDRAWMTIDNKLFLWSFHESADFSRYDSQSELILHVGLVPAKPNVFIDSITHLLVICTPTTLILLGLSNAQGGADLTLYATDLSISTDGVGMSDVRSMPDGRTFMTGSDGCLYEMQYRADEGWFTKRCSLVNWTGGSSGLGMLGGLVPEFLKGKQEDPIVHLTIDPTRSVLYALTKYSNIELFLIGSDGQSLTKIARASDICRTALMLAPDAHAMLQSNGFTIMSVSPIERGEGEGGAQMVAVTGRGVRLYFSYHRKGYAGIRPTAGPPTALELTHVRLRPLDLTVDDPNLSPPLSLPANNPVSASSVYLSGVFIAPQKSSRDNLDVVLFTTTDLGRMSQSVTQPQQQQQQQQQQTQPNQNQQLNAYSSPPASTRPPLIEQALALPIEGRTWAVAEVPHPLSHGSSFSCPPSLKVPGRGDLRLNELSAQTEVGQRTFLILSNMGMHVIVKQRPVDMLKAVLEAGAGGREGEVVAFFDNFGRDQSCAMCLALASAPEPSSSLGPGGLLSSAIPGPVSPDAVAGAKRLFYEFGGKPVKVDRGYGSQANTQLFFSGRHEGLSIYLSRLLRPIWREKVSRLQSTPMSPNTQISNAPESVLTSVQRDLNSLKTFIDRNSQLFTSGPSIEHPHDRSSEVEAWKAEQASLASLVALVTQAIEALSFVLLLIDYKLSETLLKCSTDLQQSFLNLTYQDLLTKKSGRDVARNVVNAIIYQQIGQQISIDTISEILQQRCGSFCRSDDVILFKALEGIRRAKDTRDPSERRESLQESLRLFSKGTSTLSLAKLKETCEEYRSLRFPAGAIELPLKCAQDWDPKGQGIGYLKDGEQPNDPRKMAYDERISCYDCVFDTLLAFDDMLNDQVNGRSAGGDVEGLRADAYNQALSSEDPLFHNSLYDWLISRRMTDQLLEIRTPFIERYLAQEPLTHARSELLWQYHVRNGHYSQAAVVQANLAQSTDLHLPLPQRLEYLTLAVANAKSTGSSSRSAPNSVEFLTDLEEKLEVAQVQIEVYRTVYESPDMEEDLKKDLMERLNERLLTISELYLDYAEPYEMLEIVLLILHTSDHRDPALISKTWEAILERTDAESEGDRLDTVAGVVSDLGRRFYPSETAFPLEFLCRRLEKYALDQRASSRPGWVPFMMKQAGVEWERIFDIFYVLFEEKMAPWHNEAALTFLVSDIGSLLSEWFSDWTRSQSAYNSRPTSRFPVLQVEEFITNSLLPCFDTVDESDPRKSTLRRLKREMMASL